MNAEIKKYSFILLKGTAAVSIANAGTKILGLVLLPVFTHYLSPEDYGTVAMVSLVLTVLALIFNPGMMSSTMRLYHSTTDEEERKLLIGSAHRFFLFIPIIPIVLGFFFGTQFFSIIFTNFKFYPYGFLAVILAFFIQPTRIWTTLMVLQYKIHITALYSTISVIIGLIITIFLVVSLKMGAMGKVLGMFPGTLFLFFISLTIIRRYTKGEWSFDSVKKQLLFGMPLIVAIWATQAMDLIGKYLLEKMTDLNSLGLYAFGLAVAQMPLFFVMGAKQLWNPIFYENMNKKDYKTVSQLSTYFVAGLTIINIVVLLFSKEALLLLVDERYYEAIPIISFLILGIFFNGLLTISNSVLGFKNKFGMISIFAFIASISNFVLNIFLIPLFGILGSALALAIGYFIFFLLGVWHQRKLLVMIQTKGVILTPIIAMIIATLLTFYLHQVFAVSSLNINEILLKILFLIITIFSFFQIKIFSRKEFDYVYHAVINKIREKK